jgi:hypothetical protein
MFVCEVALRRSAQVYDVAVASKDSDSLSQTIVLILCVLTLLHKHVVVDTSPYDCQPS